MPKPIDWLDRPRMALPKIVSGMETDQASNAGAFSGISNIVSGGTTVVVSTTRVLSASLILLTPQRMDVATHEFLNFSVGSIVNTSRFTIKAQQATVDTCPVGWLILNPLT